MSLIFLASILFFILSIFFLAQTFLSFKSLISDQALSSLESGFENLKPILIISSPFFFLAVLFVLFDLELLLLFPSVFMSMNSIFFIYTWGAIVFVILMTLALEWAWYGLKWLS